MAEDNTILMEELQSIVALYFFFTHQRDIAKLGTPETMLVTSNPIIPKAGINTKFKTSPIADVVRASFMLTSVRPWLLLYLLDRTCTECSLIEM